MLEGVAFTLRSWLKSGFGHEQHQAEGQQHEHATADQDRQMQGPAAGQDRQQHTCQRSSQAPFIGAQEDPVGGFFTDLIRKPGLRGAAGEGVTQSPQYLGQQDGQKDGYHSLQQKTHPH